MLESDYSLIVVTGLEKVDPIILNEVNDSVFLGKSARPCFGGKILKRFRLTYAGERITHNGFHQFECTQRNLPICSNPILQVLAELFLKYGVAFS